MPIYEFECVKTNSIAEIILPLSLAGLRWIICPIHFKVENSQLQDINGLETNEYHNAEKVFSTPAINIKTPPTNYFKNPRTGEIKTATHSNQRPPIGFIKEEARNLQERLKLEKRLNFDQQIENEIKSDTLNEAKERSRKARHEELRSQMGDMDTHSQLLVKKAMERTNKKKEKRKKSEVRIAVNHMDSSNMDK